MFFKFTLDTDYIISYDKWYIIIEKRLENKDKWKILFQYPKVIR